MTGIVEFLEQHMFACSVKSITGLDCPGCGMQRAFIALLKGDLEQSIHLNASLIPFLLTIVFALAHLCFSFRHGARLLVIFFSITVAVMLLNFLLKMFA